MTTFEFVSVLLSLVVSLALAHVLTVMARMLVAKEMKFSFLLFGWMAVALFNCIDLWFSLWAARDTPAWSLGYILLWLAAAIAIYLFAWVVAPEGKLDGVDLRAYYEENRRKFLPLATLYLVFGFLINMTVSQFQALASVQAAAFYMPAIAAWIWPQRWVQFAALTFHWLLLIGYAVQFLGMM